MTQSYPLAEIARRLDERFDVRRFAEDDGWDFGLTGDEKAALLAQASATFRATFNGLLLAEDDDARSVGRVYLVVFPTDEILAEVLAEQTRNPAPAVIVTHHPLSMRMRGVGFRAISPATLDALEAAAVAMYVIHSPLDCHPEISTSGALADGLGLRRVGVFGPYYAGHSGVIGEQAPEPFDAFAERVRRLCELPALLPSQTRFAGRTVQRVAILAGGGDSIEDQVEAEALGADTYLAGQWWSPHDGDWADTNRTALIEHIAASRMNYLGCSHDGSELVVFRDRLAPLLESWGMDAVLPLQEDHWR